MSFLAGSEAPPQKAQRWLVSEHALAALEASHAERQLHPDEHAAILAHMARAASERAYAEARRELSAYPRREVVSEGEPRAVATLLGELISSSSAAHRSSLIPVLDAAAEPVVRALERGAEEASRALADLLAQVTVVRHPDAGPEGGSAPLAEAFLAETQDLTQEAVRFVWRRAGAERGSLADLPLGLAVQPSHGCFPREGRLRRLAEDFEPLGLRRALSGSARSTFEHDGPYWTAHVLPLEVPGDVRLAQARQEAGFLSELGAAEGVGRMVALVHASRSLPVPLLQPTAGTVSRAMGALSVQWFTLSPFLQRSRGLSVREAADHARLAAAYSVLDARLCAAAVLARATRASERRVAAAELCGRALLCTVPEALSSLLTLRLSASACLRAKVWAFDLASALRERFDEDFYRNPHSEGVLRGAFARGGGLAVEAFAEELGAQRSLGIRRLSELF